MKSDSKRDIQEQERTTVDEAREQGIGQPEEGIELKAPSYADPGGVADLGADEPVVPPRLRGTPPSEQDGQR